MITKAKVFEFGDCILDCDRFELTRAGYRVKIERKPMELLILLVTRQGSLVTRDEIAASLWDPDVFVDVNASINTLIRKIRYALRDSAEQPLYLETVAGKGYRFVCEVVVKAPVHGLPLNGTRAATTTIEAPSISFSEPAPAPPALFRFRSGRITRFVWLGIACGGILILAAVASYWLHNRRHLIKYTQLTDFADSASAPSLSPDGHMLVFLRGSALFSTDQIYVKTLPNGEAKRLTDSSEWKYNPVFSPDGSQIAYTVLHGKSFETRVLPVVGGESRLLLDNAAGLRWLGPDEVLFSRIRSGLHMGVVRGKLTNEQFHDVYYPAKEEEMAHYSFPSPDHSVAIVVQMDENKNWTQCRLISLDHLSPWRYVGPEGSCTAAAWSPDGSWMYFTASIKGKSHLWRQGYPNETPEQITFGPAEEEGVAMEPDGQSVITSFGVRQTSLWLHQPAGDRALVMEGDILGSQLGESKYPPSFSRDGKFIYYLLRRNPDLEPELSRVDVNSGKSEAELPGVPMHDFDISKDGKRVLYSCRSSQGATDLCIASIDGNSTLRRIPVPGALFPRFGTPGKLFFDYVDGNSRYFEEINEDGSGRQKVLPAPVFDDVLVSPARRWLFSAFSMPSSDVQFRAISLQGDAAKTYCSTPCYPYWSPDGKWLYVPVENAAGTNPGRSLAIPIGPNETLPEFPAGGIEPGTEPSAMPGSVSINRERVIPSSDPAVYAYLSVNTQRNLYRITLP